MEKFIAAGSKCRLVKVTRDIGTSFAKRPDKQRRVRFVRRACSSPLNLPRISHLSSALPTCELQITRRTRAIATTSTPPSLPLFLESSSPLERSRKPKLTPIFFPSHDFTCFRVLARNKFGPESRILMVGILDTYENWVRNET